MNIAYRKIEELKEYEKNANKHPQKQIDLLAQNIQEFGFTTPVLISKENEVIAGHARLEALRQLKWVKVPCVLIDYLSKKQIKALRLADNKLASMSDWDMDLVIEELKELDNEMVDLTGFEKDLLVELDNKDDEVPEAPEEPKAKYGDIYQLGLHRIVCGDATKQEDVEKLMDGKKAQILITDPPYGVEYGDKNEFLNSIGKGNRIQDEIIGDEVNIFYEDWVKKWLGHLQDKLNDVFYIFISGKNISNLIKAIRDIGYKYSQDLVWVKNNHILGRLDYNLKHENIVYGWINTHENRGLFNTSVLDDEQDIRSMKRHELLTKIKELQKALNNSVIRENKPTKSALHSTMKPVTIIEKFILDSTKRNEIVIDLFLGSGSTLIAAEKTNRICYGMELAPKYIDVTIQRYIDYTGDKEVIRLNDNKKWKDI